MSLLIKELTFSAAHYIPNHERGCGGVHGHTYYVRNLSINVPFECMGANGITIDFGYVKRYFKENWDHKFIVPSKYYEYWKNFLESDGLEVKADNLVSVEHTTVEYVSRIIQRELTDLFNAEVHFELSEGPNQGYRV